MVPRIKSEGVWKRNEGRGKPIKRMFQSWLQLWGQSGLNPMEPSRTHLGVEPLRGEELGHGPTKFSPLLLKTRTLVQSPALLGHLARGLRELDGPERAFCRAAKGTGDGRCWHVRKWATTTGAGGGGRRLNSEVGNGVQGRCHLCYPI